MNCLNCGSPIDPSKKFCHICGYPIQAAPIDNGDTPTEFAETPIYQNTAPVYNQAPAYTQQSAQNSFDEPPKKPKLGKKILIPVVAVVLAIVVALSGSAIYMAANPQLKIASALEKTLFSAKSFNAEVKIEGETIGEGYVAFGKTTFTSDFYADVAFEGFEIVCNDGNLVLNFGGQCVEVSLPDAFATVQSGLDDIISAIEYGATADDLVDMVGEEFGVEITPEQVMDWAENLIKDEKINEDVIKDIYDTVGVPFIANELDIDAEDVPTYKELRKILSGALTKGINGDGFEVTDSKSKDGIKYYDVTLHMGELYISMLEYILDCKQLEGVFESDMGKDVKEDLEERLEELKEFKEDGDDEFEDFEAEFTVGIDGGYLVYFEIDDMIAVTLSEINKNQDAEEDYNAIVDDAEEYTKLDVDNVEDALNQVAQIF